MSSSSPTVTVVVPTFNSSGTLRLTLETVVRQDFTDFEVWVIGDGCTDDSEAVVSSFGDRRLNWMNLHRNSGTPSLPRNEALHRARGRLIAYLGHDDLWFPWHLTGLVDCIERSASDFVFSLGLILDPKGVIGSFTIRDKAWDLKKGYLSPSNWLHRKDLIDAIGPWSPEIRLGDDCDFLGRLHTSNARLRFSQQLSVLKFPSSLWRMYSLTSHFPQGSYVEAMRQDAAKLRLELLMELATVVSRQEQRFSQDQAHLNNPLYTLIDRAFDTYGRQRWPLNQFLYWRWRRMAGLRDKKRSAKK